LVLVLLTACSNAGSDLGLLPVVRRSITVVVSLDRDASGSTTNVDTAYTGARVLLRPAAGGQPIDSALSDNKGFAFFENVPVGRYAVTVDPASVGDSVAVSVIDPDIVTLVAGDDNGSVALVLLSYPTPSLQAVRQFPLGKRVLVRGLILAGIPSFRDTTAYIKDTSGYLRLTRVSFRGGQTGNNPGDTVSAIGTTSTRAGQPTLDLSIITTLGSRPAPVPIPLSTAVAGTAMGGFLDAGLVVITSAVISDTATIAPDFSVVASDGSGPLTIVLDSQGGYNPSSFVPGRTVTVRGVLVPSGTGSWQLKPRGTSDVILF